MAAWKAQLEQRIRELEDEVTKLRRVHSGEGSMIETATVLLDIAEPLIRSASVIVNVHLARPTTKGSQ